MIGAGTFISPLIKIITTVAILADAGSDTARIGRCNQRFDPANP